MENIDTTQLGTIINTLDRLRTSSPGLNGEPEFGRLADPPGKALVHAYLQNLPLVTGKPIFYAEIPPRAERPTGEAWLLKTLLKQWGDLDWDKRESSFDKELRLKALLKRGTQLVVVADIHLLGTNPKASLQFDLLLSLFQTGQMMPLVIIGEPVQMEQLLATDMRFARRFSNLYLG